MRKVLLAVTAATLTVPALPAPAFAHDGYHSRHGGHHQRYRSCRRSSGTTGLILGGAAGALAGRAIDTRGERTTGTILGAAAGALLGREVQRGRSSRRCR